MIRRAALVFALGVAAAGCADKQLEQLQAVRDEVCACKTPDCVQAAMAKLPKEELRSDHRSQTVARQMLDCQAAVDDAGKPSEDPDAMPGSDGSDAPGNASDSGSGSAAGTTAGSAVGSGGASGR